MTEDTKKIILIGIFVGIIVFIICYIFIQPVMDFITPIFLNCLSKCSSFFSDKLYKNAASMDKHSFNATLYAFTIGFISYIPLLALILSFIKKKKKVDKPRQITGHVRWKLRVMSAILLISLAFISLQEYANYYLNLRFERKIAILSPYLSEQGEEELVAQWAMMENKKDYASINDILYNIAQKNNINKPKALWN